MGGRPARPGEYAQIEGDLTATNRVMVVMRSPLDRRPTRASVGSTREGKLNLQSAMAPMRNFGRNRVCNQRASDLHIVATRARHAIPRYPRAKRVQINR